jgi:hypothetical protein
MTDTLAEARRHLQANLDDGIVCPCCGQHAQRYRRQINGKMARSLILIHRLRGLDWCYLPAEIPADSREEGKLAYWGLLEEALVEREDGGRAGWWRVTGRGRQFILNGMRVPRTAIVYNAVCVGFDTSKLVTIRDCLGKKFNLRELLGGTDQ